MPRKKPSRAKARKALRRLSSAGWLPLLLTAMPAIALVTIGLILLLRTAPAPTDTLLQSSTVAQPVPRSAPPYGEFSSPLLSGESNTPVGDEIPASTEKIPASGKPRLAIIMDDLGRDLRSARTLLAIDLPVTFAILPGEAQARQVAQLAHLQGREVLIHLPMEPRAFPVVDPGDDALLIEQSPEELRRRFQTYLQQVPHATGANNHMGSRFTEHSEGLAVIFAEMKEAGLFFVDSITSSKSVALTGARNAGLRAVGRDLFLDNVQDVDRIAAEIHRLVAVAEKRGQAIGICHPYPQTMEALRREAPYLRERVEMVAVSRLLPL